MKEHQKLINGVQMEAVRCRDPRPHWRIRVVATGYLYESGVFCGCRPLAKVWETVADIARRRGDSWHRECMEAHL